ncbi:hypothetical protein YP1_053_00030 [Yersinia pseudotuberculosis NBRC 105692]|nr:hypothetical protein YP1_053_00030 [Yersinia pseudotuberculosis NBRC 105692]
MTIKPSDSVSWFQVLQRGQHYMKTWPADKRLAPVFPENRVTVVTRFGIRFMPPLAIFTLTWQIALGGATWASDRHGALCLRFTAARIMVVR